MNTKGLNLVVTAL